MIEFLLVVIVTVIVAICVSTGQGGRRRVLIVIGAFAAWMILPSIILQAHWGFYHEGSFFGGAFLEQGPSSETSAEKAARVAAGICADAGEFDVEDRFVYFTAMDEHPESKHFFYYSKFSDISWLGVGWRDRYCLAKYQISMRRDGDLDWSTSHLFPYPYFHWISYSRIVERQFIDRAPIPKSPDGIRALLPGQCAWGDIPKGESRRFQVEMPGFVRRVELVIRFLCDYGYDSKFERAFEWTKDGAPLGQIKATRGGGVYQVTLRAPGDEDLGYGVAVASPEGACPEPKSWDLACDWNRDPNDPGRRIPSRAKGRKAVVKDDN